MVGDKSKSVADSGEEEKTEVSLTELIRELIQGKKEQRAKLIDVA